MGPDWLVIVVAPDGTATVETFSLEEKARARFDVHRKTPNRTVYLAPWRSKAVT